MASILIIDDDALIRRMLRRILEEEGYEVLEAANGTEGLNLNRRAPADLVITDILMPEKEGIETIGELTGEFPDVKIIAVSGGGRIGPDAYLKMARDFGALKTIKKPINKTGLLNAVKEVLSDSEKA